VSGYSVRSRDPETGKLVTRRLRPPEPRFVVVLGDEERIAVADRGAILFYATEGIAFDLARYLNPLDPTDAQLEVLLGRGDHARLLRRIKPGLRHDGVCNACGAAMPEGTPAWWHPLTRVTRHVGRCPKPAAVDGKRRKAA
jgi:hypothetical protein